MWIPFLMPKPFLHKPLAIRSTMFYFLLLSSIATTGVAFASGSETGNSTIGLRDAISKTIAHNPNLRAFDYQLKAQQGRVQQA